MESKVKNIFLFLMVVLFVLASIVFNSIGEHEEEVQLEQLNRVEEEIVDLEVEEEQVEEILIHENVEEVKIELNETERFMSNKISFLSSKDYYSYIIDLPVNTGTISYFDANKELITLDFDLISLPKDTLLFINTKDKYYLIGPVYRYKDIGNGTIISVDQGDRFMNKIDDQWQLEIRVKRNKDEFGLIWTIDSNKKLVDFTKENLKSLWRDYDLVNNARLGFDGYYYRSPDSYDPTDKKAFWKNPSMYILEDLLTQDSSRASQILGNGLLSIGMSDLNSDGYFPTLPESNWLKTDYNIDEGFFDTRFNADSIENYILAYKKYKNQAFRDVYLAASKYYVDHCINHHYDFSSDEYGIGWLVEDYAHENNLNDPTHVSLNHQLQGIHMFMLLYEEEDNSQYLDMAMLMLNGIKNTEKLWIMENQNLEYAYLPNGEMGFVDYPYLTYNDLLDVQNDLMRIIGSEDEVLNRLLVAKKTWMDRNNVTGYNSN